MDKPNGKITRVELELMVDQLLEAVPAALRLYPVQAQALKAKYDALVAAGFDAKQALEIVKTRPIFE